MSLKTPTVVITGSGTVTCQSVIKALRIQNELPVRIVTVDASDNVAGRYFSDAFHTVPAASDPEFVPTLLDICRRYEARLLVPIVDYEFRPLSLAIEQFRQTGCLVAISPPETIRRANDKLETDRFFRQYGFPTARTWSADSAREESAELPYPVFLKPAIDGRSSLDCHVVSSREELVGLLERLPNSMVQQMITGCEYTADVLADWNSSVIGVVIRERIETKGGVSYKGRTVADPEMEAHVVRMVPLLGLHGPANIQAFRRGDELFFNEINPRFSGALALSLAAGFNSPLQLLKLALGLPVQTVLGQTEIGLTMLRYWDEVFVDEAGEATLPSYNLAPPAALLAELAS